MAPDTDWGKSGEIMTKGRVIPSFCCVWLLENSLNYFPDVLKEFLSTLRSRYFLGSSEKQFYLEVPSVYSVGGLAYSFFNRFKFGRRHLGQNVVGCIVTGFFTDSDF